MKLDNKGITLVEIVVSVALISIVLIFLFSLLIQVNNENADNEVRSSYLVNQAAYIKQIEEDFIDYKFSSGSECNISEIKKDDPTSPLYIPRLKGDIELNNNIKCLKFTFAESPDAYLFLYKRDETATAEDPDDFQTILSYYRGDFRQSVELEEFSWADNAYEVKYAEDYDTENSITYKTYSLPIIGPDYNDYSINISYAKTGV